MKKSRGATARKRRRESIWELLVRAEVVLIVLIVVAGFVGTDATREALAGTRQKGIWLAAAIACILAARWVLRAQTKIEKKKDEPLHAAAFANGGFGPFEQPVSRLLQEPREEIAHEWSAEILRRFEWKRFEALVEAFYQAKGYPTRTQTHGADGGVDVWLCSKDQRDLPIAVVQVKHWVDRMVGVSTVRELLGTMTANNLKAGVVVASGEFSREAQAFADRGLSIDLVSGRELVRDILTLPKADQDHLLEVAFQGEFWRPTCTSCGVKLVWREQGFWGCRNYPRCKSRAYPRRPDVTQ